MSDYCVPPDACHPERPFFVATVSYTAVCPDGTSGESVTKTAQCESHVSYEHARQLARDKAKCDAEAGLVCLFTSNRCVIPECAPDHPGFCASGTGITQAIADASALASAQSLASDYCDFTYIFDFSTSTGGDQSTLFIAALVGGGAYNDSVELGTLFLELGTDYESDAQIDFSDFMASHPTATHIVIQTPHDSFSSPRHDDSTLSFDSVTGAPTFIAYPRPVRIALNGSVTDISMTLHASPITAPAGVFLLDVTAFTSPQDDPINNWLIRLYLSGVHQGSFDAFMYSLTGSDGDASNTLYARINQHYDPITGSEGATISWDAIRLFAPPTGIAYVATTDHPLLSGSWDDTQDIPLTPSLMLDIIDSGIPLTITANPVAPAGPLFRLKTDSAFDAIFGKNAVYLMAGYATNPYNNSYLATYTEGVDYTIGSGNWLDFTAAILAYAHPLHFFGFTAVDPRTGPETMSAYELQVLSNTPSASMVLTNKIPETFSAPVLANVLTFDVQASEPTGWRFILGRFAFNATRNRGFNLQSRHPNVGSFATDMSYVKGVHYLTTDAYIDITAGILVSDALAPRQYRIQEVCNTGGSDFSTGTSLAVLSASPAAQITQGGTTSITVTDPSAVTFCVLIDANADELTDMN